MFESVRKKQQLKNAMLFFFSCGSSLTLTPVFGMFASCYYVLGIRFQALSKQCSLVASCNDFASTQSKFCGGFFNFVPALAVNAPVCGTYRNERQLWGVRCCSTYTPGSKPMSQLTIDQYRRCKNAQQHRRTDFDPQNYAFKGQRALISLEAPKLKRLAGSLIPASNLTPNSLSKAETQCTLEYSRCRAQSESRVRSNMPLFFPCRLHPALPGGHLLQQLWRQRGFEQHPLLELLYLDFVDRKFFFFPGSDFHPSRRRSAGTTRRTQRRPRVRLNFAWKLLLF